MSNRKIDSYKLLRLTLHRPSGAEAKAKEIGCCDLHQLVWRQLRGNAERRDRAWNPWDVPTVIR